MGVEKLSVVVPAFNEERRLPRGVASIVNYLTETAVDFEIVIVDDGSADGTDRVVEDLARRFPQVRGIRLSTNSGKGAAVTAGVLSASGSHILFCDADQSTPIDQLAALLVPVIEDRFDIAIASRALATSRVVVGQKRYRQLLAQGFGTLTRMMLVRGFRDCQCGFKLFTREAARDIFSNITCRNALFDMELMLLAARRRLRIAEVAVEWRHDPDSRLTYSFPQSLGLVRELLRMKLRWRVLIPAVARVTAYDGARATLVTASTMARDLNA